MAEQENIQVQSGAPWVQAALMGVLNTLPDAILLLDEQWRLVYANETACRLSRIQPENLNRETLWDLYPALLGTELERAYREAVKFQEERRVEAFYYEPFEGWFDIRSVPLEQGVAVHYRDVTDVFEAEAARDLKTEQLEQVLRATTDAVFSLDREWRFTFVNRVAQDLLKQTPTALIGKNIWELFPEAAHPGSPYLECYTRTMNEGIATEFEAFYPAPLDIHVHVFAKPSRDGIIVFFRDITETRRAAAELRESQERLSAIYSGTFEYIGLISPDGTILDCNRASLEFAGNTRDEVVGLKFWEGPWWIYTPGAPEWLKEWIARAAAGEFVRYEAPLVRPSGEVITFDFSLHPMFDESGHVILLVPEGRDITELKRAEAALMQSEKLAAVG